MTNHKVYVYGTWSTTVSVSSSELGPPTPSSASVCRAPLPNHRGDTLACALGDGRFQFGRLEKKPSTLSTL